MTFTHAPLDLDDERLGPPSLDALIDEIARHLEEDPENQRPWGGADSALAAAYFSRALRQAFEFHAECLHAFVDQAKAALRMQICMPVSSRYRQRNWNALPLFDLRVADFAEGRVSGRQLEWATWKARRCAPERRYDWVYLTEYPWPPAPFETRSRAWVEMLPMAPGAIRQFFPWLRGLARMKPTDREGRFAVRWHRRRKRVAVLAASRSDVRLYFGAARPPIRPNCRRSINTSHVDWMNAQMVVDRASPAMLRIENTSTRFSGRFRATIQAAILTGARTCLRA